MPKAKPQTDFISLRFFVVSINGDFPYGNGTLLAVAAKCFGSRTGDCYWKGTSGAFLICGRIYYTPLTPLGEGNEQRIGERSFEIPLRQPADRNDREIAIENTLAEDFIGRTDITHP